MKKLFMGLFSIAFFIVCLIPGLGILVVGPSPEAANEAPVRAPSLTDRDGNFNINLLSDAADWFSQSFALRRELITADSALKAKLFHTSSQSLVALGQDEWLYYAQTLEDYSGADKLSERQVFCIARSLALAREYVEFLYGAELIFTIAPNKAGIYPEYLPSGLFAGDMGYADAVISELKAQNVGYCDLFQPLREGAQAEQLYFTADSHWNNRGAALAHDILLGSLEIDGNAFAKSGEYRRTHKGDLYDMLYPAGKMRDLEFEFDDPLEFEYVRPIRGADDLRIDTESHSEHGPLLMFRDSFGNALHSLMAESFSRAIFSRAMPYDLSMGSEIGAEYAVIEIVERNLPMLAQGNMLMQAKPITANELEIYGEAVGCEVEPELTIQPFKLAGEDYQQVSGSVDCACDPDSPVWLALETAGGELYRYEAQPIADGDRVAFSGCLLGGLDGQNIRVLFLSGGRLMIA